jgi:hypothetical protein
VGTNWMTGLSRASRKPAPIRIIFAEARAQVDPCTTSFGSWNYMVRLYRSHAEVLSGKWKLPEAQRVN